MNRASSRRVASALCTASVAAFAGFYAAAAWLYPGGTREDPARRGYSFGGNNWCDLLDATTWGGRPNPGRPVRIAGTMILCGGLAILWWFLAASLGSRWRAVLVRVAGIGSALVAPLVATSWHDRAVSSAGALGLAAFLAWVLAAARWLNRPATSP